ncbi:MAG: ribonuclease P protein component [Prevotellaceae bacterium]|jgi:ribonuclease P protein component|nr:ribonuclease P protein component [Prevotellaceae bacterium]
MKHSVTNRKFCKSERLCSQKVIAELFNTGTTMKQFPFKVVYSYCPFNQSPVKIAVGAPKKIYRKAVMRNCIKRKIREAYRQNKHILYDLLGYGSYTLNIMLVYVSSTVLSYVEIEKKLVQTLSKLVEDLKKDADFHTGTVD